MNIQFMLDSIPIYIEAIKLTLTISFWGILFSIILGFFCASIEYYKIPVLKKFVQIYIELSRNTPLLIQLFFLYYGFPQVGLKLEAESCAIIGLSFLGGSYMSEAIRAGLESIHKSQLEAGLSIGLNNWQLMRYIIFPQAFKFAIPAFIANIIFLLKETSIVSAIALADIMFITKDLIGMYYKTSESLLMLVIAYILLLLPLSLFFSYLERRLNHA